jgi:hypothetical protein
LYDEESVATNESAEAKSIQKYFKISKEDLFNGSIPTTLFTGLSQMQPQQSEPISQTTSKFGINYLS